MEEWQKRRRWHVHNLIRISAAALLALLLARGGAAQELWTSKDGAIRDVDARSIAVLGERHYLATKNEVYAAESADGAWKPVFMLSSGENEIVCLDGNARYLFVGTRRGLFRSRDKGQRWEEVFRTILPGKKDITSIALAADEPDRIAITTHGGVFMSEDGGGRWEDISGSLKNRPLARAAFREDSLYVAGSDGCYIRRGAASGWERALIRSVAEEAANDDPQESQDDEPAGEEPVGCITIRQGALYVGLERRVLVSDDAGATWRSLPAEGLAGTVQYLLPSAKGRRVYCATTKGVFELDADAPAEGGVRWRELYRGMDKRVSVNGLAFDGEDERYLWAVSDRGVYRFESGRYAGEFPADIERSLGRVKATFDNEPTFRELQQAAIRYAEVGPEKIARWRRESKMRALLPKVSVGFDNDRSNTAEIYTSATKDYVIAGPDDISSGWDVSVAWELGDLIWSDDQTNIDVRSRLMVQLRNDILDDLRRTYYERRRVQFELLSDSPGDIKGRFDKEMRLAELTAKIDDLTGNYFSKHQKDVSN